MELRMAQGSVGKFTTYSQEERGRQAKQPKPESKPARIYIEDDDDDNEFDIPARFTQKWEK
jgi:hypothetical protein